MDIDSELKKKLIIAGSIGFAIIAGIFIKNKVEESRFKPLPKETVLQILKKGRKENFGFCKQVATLATSISAQMGTAQIDPQMVKAYLEAPDSPIKPQQNFEKNYTTICQSLNTTYGQFNESVDFYLKNGDKEVKQIVEESEKDFETSLQGKTPEIKVVVPSNLTKDRLIEIQKKLSLKRYLIQVEMFRKIRGKTQQELASDEQLLKSLPNPEVEQQAILNEEGLGENDQPSAAVFGAAVAKLRNDEAFKKQIIKIETHYTKIFNKYKLKIQQNKITDNELNELEDELIYSTV